MVTGWHRPTWIEIDRAAIRENIKNEQNNSRKVSTYGQ